MHAPACELSRSYLMRTFGMVTRKATANKERLNAAVSLENI
jgi:hypothetical protein